LYLPIARFIARNQVSEAVFIYSALNDDRIRDVADKSKLFPRSRALERKGSMDVRQIVGEIDAEIASLQQARAVLIGLNGNAALLKPHRGRPKGSTNAVKAVAVKEVVAKALAAKVVKAAPRKRTLSPEGRKRIADAMKRRWADRRKALKKDVAPKKEAVAKK
jgi:hypothetical protein